MTWALKRQIFYIFVLIGFFLLTAFVVGYPYINKAPSCVDSKQNGDETGIDCGGSCAKACEAEVNRLSVLWSRIFEVVPGRFNAVAYVENKNVDTAVYKIKYRFRFADRENIYIGKREGETFIPPAGKFAVFEPAIDLGNSIPVYTTFEFTEEPVWVKVPADKANQLQQVYISNVRLEDEATSPKLFASIKNNSLFIIPEIKVVAIMYDALGNAVNVSGTYLELLRGEQSAELNFTWPQPFNKRIVTKEIIPMYNVFLAKLK
jgi:hypothetical protein